MFCSSLVERRNLLAPIGPLGLLIFLMTGCGEDVVPTPTEVEDPPETVLPLDVAVGDNHACSLDSAGRAFCWGTNGDGQIGDGTFATALSPTPVQGGLAFTSIVAGENHACALDTDGRAWCWGGEGSKGTLGNGVLESSARPVAVAGGRSFVSLSRAADDHVCGIDETGAAFCWGEAGPEGRLGDGSSVTPQASPVHVAGDVTFSRIGTGWLHTCGIATGGEMYCWGRSYGATPTPLGDGRVYTDLSVGFDHTCGLDEDGVAFCWGENQSGQLGSGFPSAGGTTPVAVAGGHRFSSLSGGRDHTCGVTESGGALCWGRNDLGQLGDGTTGQECLEEACRSAPVPVAGDHTFERVVGGARANTCGITTDGDVLCWGSNVLGQLGQGPDSPLGPQLEPRGPLPGGDFVQVRLGSWAGHACGYGSDGAVACWGSNDVGQLGQGDFVDSATPRDVGGISGVTSLDAGIWHTCAVDGTGNAQCWGGGGSGQLGRGYNGDSARPEPVVGGLTFAGVAAGYRHACGLDLSGAAWCWGSNLWGQLGNPSSTISLEPALVAGALVFDGLDAGGDHSCGLQSDGSAWCWGRNDSGQLGDGSTSGSGEPVQVADVSLAQVVVGGDHTCGLSLSGQAFCWGANDDGQLGDGSTSAASVPVAVAGAHTFVLLEAAGSHSCGVDDSGRLLCWGANDYGQLGDGSTVPRSAPTVVSSSISWQQVDGGLTTTCAVATSGGSHCWGSGGLLGSGYPARSLLPVAVLPF